MHRYAGVQVCRCKGVQVCRCAFIAGVGCTWDKLLQDCIEDVIILQDCIAATHQIIKYCHV